MRTLEEAIDYLDYHSPNEETIPKHNAVNDAFKQLMAQLWPNYLMVQARL